MRDVRWKAVLLTTLCMSIILGSCEKIVYRYQGIAYDKAEDALSAQQRTTDKVLANIEKSTARIAETAIVFLPSNNYICNNYIKWTGAIEVVGAKEKDELCYSSASSLLISMRAFGAALERSKLVNKVAFETNDDSESASFGGEVALLLRAKDKGYRWYLRKREAPGAMVQIEEASGALPPIIMMNQWVKNVASAFRFVSTNLDRPIKKP